MNIFRLSIALVLALSIASSAWAVDEGQTKPRLNSQGVQTNTTADVIPLASGSGNIKGFQCMTSPGTLFPNARLHFYVDGGAAQTIDPGPAMTFPDANGDYHSAAFPMNIRFESSIKVTVQRVSGTGSIWCSVSWGLD